MSSEVNTRRVYVDGVWDMFHPGHVNLLKQAINKAEEKFPKSKIQLIVGVCDTGVTEYKRKTIMNLKERSSALKAHELVTTIIKDSPLRVTHEFIAEYKLDLVIHGNDFTEEKRNFYYGDAVEEGKYAEVPYTKGVSTSQLIREAKALGHFTVSPKTALLDEDELIRRIQLRTWEELNLEPVSISAL